MFVPSKISLLSIPVVILCLFFYELYGESPFSVELTLPATRQAVKSALKELPETFFIDNFLIEADVPISEKEFGHLFNSKKNSLVSRHDLELGILLSQKKNKFEKIEITLTPTLLGYMLHVELHGHWTFYKIKIHGFLLNKDQFASYYSLEPGQRFDLDKHQESLEHIKNILRTDGYFNADIKEDLVFDDREKSICVHLTIDRKSQFRIGGIEIAPRSENVGVHELQLLKEKMVKHLASTLQGSYYNKNNVHQEIKLMKLFLRKKGFIASELRMNEEIIHDQSLVDICLNLHIAKQKKFTFFGNHFFSEVQLFEKISIFGKEICQIPIAIIAAELEDLYKKNGFLSVRVTAEEDKNTCVFIINEGSHSYIGNILLEGNDLISKIELQKLLVSYQKNYLDVQTQKKIIDDLTTYYRTRGFWDISVVIANLESENALGAHSIRVRIHEGKQRFYAGANASFMKEFLSDSLKNQFERVDCPIPFDVAFLDQQRQILIQKLFQNGYLYSRIKPELIDEGDAIRVDWKPMSKMEQVNFGKTVVVGNSRLAYEKISREIAYKEGMIWDREKITRTVDRLRSLGIFESVSLYPADEGSPYEPNKSLILHVVEGSPMEARLRLGYQHVSLIRGSTYKIGGSLMAKNPTNNADYMRFDADMTRFYQSVALIYERPWFFDMPVKNSLRGYMQTYEQPLYMGSRDILYTADHDGFCANFDRTFRYGDFGVSFGCDWLRTRGISPVLAQAIQFSPFLIGKKVPYIFFEPHLLIDILDDSINPTRGTLTLLSFRSAVSPEHMNLSLAKIMVEQSLFFPCNKRIVGAIRVRFGTIFHENFQTIMPHDRFYLGGPHSLRSIEPNMAPPLGVFGAEQVHVPMGGKTMLNINLEARFVLSGNLGGVLFQDIGALFAKKIPSILTDELSAGSGFGLRYATPMGPIRFDFGIKWKKRFIGDCRTAWFLTFGHAF